jgi:hypothetical protein
VYVPDWKDISLFLFLGTLLVYKRTFRYGLVSDDIPAFRKVEALNKQHPLTWTQKLYWEFRGVSSMKRGHIFSVICHAITVVLIYWAFGNPLAAVLFAVNPITLMVSTWISGRSYGFATALALLSWILPAWTVVFYSIAIYWSISALSFALVMPYLGWQWAWLPGLFIVGTWLRFKRPQHFNVTDKESKISKESNAELRALRPRKLIVFTKTYGYYFFDTIFVYRMGLFHKFLYRFGLNQKEHKIVYSLNRDFWVGVLALGITGLGILKGQFLTSVGFAWFFINVAMWGNIITFNQQITERYLYLPAVGLMLALASILPTNILLMFAAYYFARLWWFMPSLESEYWNVEYNVFEAKDLYYIWLSRGVHRYAEGRYQEALGNMMQAYGMQPDDFKVNYNIFWLGLLLGDTKLAAKHLEDAGKCKVDGKEEEQAAFCTKGAEMLKKVEEGIAKEGKCQIDTKDIQLIL